MRAARWSIAALFICALNPLHAVPVTVHVRTRAPGTAAIVVRHANATNAVRTSAVTTPGQAELDLPAGLWVVTASGEGLLERAASVYVKDVPVAVALDLPATGSVRGEFGTRHDQSDPASMKVRYTTRTAEFGTISGEAVCALDHRKWLCTVPTGTSELQFRPDEFVPVFRFDIAVSRECPIEIGTLPLQVGAAVFGNVRARAKQTGPVTVALQPVTAGFDYGNPAQQEFRRTPLEVHTDRRGFFQFIGVAAGRYDVHARQRGAVSTNAVIDVDANDHVEIREPLLLGPPRTIRVEVSPHSAPGGGRWSVSLHRLSYGGKRSEPVTQSAADGDGRWSTGGLAPGSYELRVGSERQVWATQQMSVQDAPDYFVPIDLPSEELSGTVRIGSRTLETDLTLDDDGGVSIEVSSDRDGKFSVTAPPRRRWNVAVRNDRPPIRRYLRDVPVHGGAMDVRLDAGMLEGTVVDDNGVPAPNAIVQIQPTDPAERLMQVHCADDGSFFATGLAGGKYRVQASDFLKESEFVEVGIENDQPTSRLRLTLVPNDEVTGTIVGPAGPVFGAEVTAFAVDKEFAFALSFPTDSDGKFAAIVPPGARQADLFIAPPGYGLRLARVPVGRKTLIRVGRDHGTLIVDTPAGRSDPPPYYVVHGESVMPLGIFENEWDTQRTTTGSRTRTTIPMLAAGVYAVCSAADRHIAAAKYAAGACVTGIVAPFSESTLSLDR